MACKARPVAGRRQRAGGNTRVCKALRVYPGHNDLAAAHQPRWLRSLGALAGLGFGVASSMITHHQHATSNNINKNIRDSCEANLCRLKWQWQSRRRDRDASTHGSRWC